jgi:hypothetical protein
MERKQEASTRLEELDIINDPVPMRIFDYMILSATGKAKVISY